MLVDLIVFDGVDELDVIGPLEVFRRAAAVGAEVAVRICSREHVEWVSGAFGVNFKPDATFVPGAADAVSYTHLDVYKRQARELRVGNALLLGKGEDSSGGRLKPSILADAMEALICLLYTSRCV